MATVIVLTEDGREVWRMDKLEPWHVLGKLKGAGDVRAGALAAGLVRAIESADRIERARVADSGYVPTLDEALRYPQEFVEGMTEE